MSPKSRCEAVLLALGFGEPPKNINNEDAWYNIQFPGIEVYLNEDTYMVTGPSSTYIEQGQGCAELMFAIGRMFKFTLDILTDEELGIEKEVTDADRSR